MYRELLSANRSRTCKQNSLAFASLTLQQFIYAFIIKVSIVIVHLLRIRAVMIHHALGRDSLTEVRLEAVNAHIKQNFQLILEPFISFGIRKVYDRHTRLPHIPLPYLAVCSLDEVSLFHTFFKHGGFLSDIAVDPYADI